MQASSGAALITSLIILAVLALLGVSTMRATTTEVQIATDMEATARSFQAAEAGLTAAADLILDRNGDRYTPRFNPNNPGEIDFSAYSPNPLADMGPDTPVVTMPSAPDDDAACARSALASSADLLGCSTFIIVSTHAPSVAGPVRDAASTTLVLGLARELIAD